MTQFSASDTISYLTLQQKDYNQFFRQINMVATIAGATILGPAALVGGLWAAGFGAAGVGAGTIAAGAQSVIGNVAAGSAFAGKIISRKTTFCNCSMIKWQLEMISRKMKKIQNLN